MKGCFIALTILRELRVLSSHKTEVCRARRSRRAQVMEVVLGGNDLQRNLELPRSGPGNLLRIDWKPWRNYGKTAVDYHATQLAGRFQRASRLSYEVVVLLARERTTYAVGKIRTAIHEMSSDTTRF